MAKLADGLKDGRTRRGISTAVIEAVKRFKILGEYCNGAVVGDSKPLTHLGRKTLASYG